MTSRKTRETLPPAHSNIGPFWLVSSDHEDHYVGAETAQEAVEVFYSIPSVAAVRLSKVKETEARKIECVSMTVYARAESRPGKTDGQ